MVGWWDTGWCGTRMSRLSDAGLVVDDDGLCSFGLVYYLLFIGQGFNQALSETD